MEKFREVLGKIASVAWPIIWTIIKFSFFAALWFVWLIFAIVGGIFFGFICAAFGIEFQIPKPPRPHMGNKKFDVQRLKREFPNMTLEQLLQQFGDSIKELEQNNRLTPQQEKIVRKVRKVSQSEIRSRIRDVLTEEEEIEVLLLLILQLLGILR